MNIDRIANEIGIDTSSLLKLFKLFIDQTEADLGSIRAAAKEKKRDMLKQSAHSIKGAALNLELKEILAAAEELEKNSGDGEAEELAVNIAALENSFENLKKVLAR